MTTGNAMTGIPALREWQKKAREDVLLKWRRDKKAKVLIAACPGAGKTFFTAVLIRELLQEANLKLAIVLAPTTNIQLLWVKELKALKIKASDKASNIALKWRKEAGVSMVEDKEVLVLTYAQLARDSQLIAEVARRTGATFLIGDEIHHVDDDEKYGEAVAQLKDECERTLALSGTPFNSVGGSIALCETEEDIDDEGKPIRRTIPTHTYSYGDALLDKDNVCRHVEFIKVYGRGEATFRSLLNNETWKKITDLATQRKTDRLSVLLDANGEFMRECAYRAVKALINLRIGGDKKAAMLVVAENKAHGAAMARLIQRTCEEMQQSFLIQEIYNDTPKAHKRIEDLVDDTTDIVVSVRMISEGVDIKRLRVGLFATNWMTRMFFVQFVGRFVRYEDRLDRNQFAWVVVPAHVTLLKYMREIESMIESAAIPGDGDGPGPDKDKSELIDIKTKAGAVGVVFRGKDEDDSSLAEAFYNSVPSMRGVVTEFQASQAAKDLGLNGASPDKPREKIIDWGNLNDLLVRAIVKRMQANGESDDDLYSRVQTRANNAVGIERKDPFTAEETLMRRHAYLKDWLKRIRFGQGDENADA